MDLYIEKINPKNPNQYEVNGQWVDMQILQETIQVAGSQPIVQTVRYTRHGPILSDVSPNLKEFQPSQQLKLPQNYAVALRWTALEPSKLGYAIPQINRAQNWQEFRTAASNYDVPAQNLVYADIDGNIGYQMLVNSPSVPREMGVIRFLVGRMNMSGKAILTLKSCPKVSIHLKVILLLPIIWLTVNIPI
jgi:acyl-homoserine lactone acylase PvdQ